MALTYDPIATTTLGSAQASVTFSSIASTYTDLVLIVSGYLSGVGYFDVQVGNGSIDTGSNYSHTRLIGYSGGVLSDRATNASQINQPTIGTGDRGTAIINFQNYSNTSTYKTTIARNNESGLGVGVEVGLWRNTSAINQIKLTGGSGNNFATGTTFTLYGIKAA